MSWLSDRWGKGPSLKGLESSVKGTAHTIGSVADSPIAKALLAAGLTATGVGAPAAAALLAGEGALGGALKNGGNLGSALEGAASGALAGGGGALVGKALGAAGGGLGDAVGHIPGAQGLGTALQQIPGVQGVEQGLRGAGGAIQKGFGALLQGAAPATGGNPLEGALGSLGGWLTGNGGKNALGVAQGVNAALLQKQANDYATQALQQEQGIWNAKAPLRAQGYAGMQTALGRNPFAVAPAGVPTAQPLRAAAPMGA